MIKISSLSDWGLDTVGTVSAKVSSRGLLSGSGDYRRLQKCAGERFADAVKNIDIGPGLEPIYSTALAATESHGYNRNGDGYRADMLAKCANTFVTHGRLYRNHKAKDPAKSYGIIKLAQFDPRMGITHVLGGLFKDAEAVARYGGGNVADEELEALAKEGSYPTSQGSSIIGGDRCVICGKNSLSRVEYCTPKSAGGVCDLFGCRDGLSKIAEDGRHQALDNPQGIFHDLSKVGFGADRQSFAYRLAQGDLQKAASGEVVPGVRGAAWLAEALGAEASIFLPPSGNVFEAQILKTAQTCAQIESQTRHELSVRSCADQDVDAGLRQEIIGTNLAKHASSDSTAYSYSAAKLSAKCRCVLSPAEFLKAAGLGEADLAVAVTAASHQFSDLANSPGELSAIAKQATVSTVMVGIDTPSPSELSVLSLQGRDVTRRALEKLAQGEGAQVLARKSSVVLSKAASDALRKYAVYRLRVFNQLLNEDPVVVSLAIRQAQLY